MSATSLLYNLLVLCSAILAVGLAAYGITLGNRIFTLFMLTLAEWSFSYVFANGAPDPATQLFWLMAADVGIAFCGPLWLLFALANTGRAELLPRQVRAGIWSIGALSLAALLINTTLAVLSSGVAAIASGATSLHRPLFWLHTLMAYSAILAGLAVMARTAVSAGSPYRERARLMLVGALVPLLVNIAYLAGLFGQSNTADITPIALVATSLAFSYAMRRHQMLTLSPIAHQVVLDSMSDGLLVVDLAGRLVEHNPAAAAIAQLPAGAVGQLLGSAVPEHGLAQALGALVAVRSESERVVTIQAPAQRSIQVTCTPLSSSTGRPLGTLMLLRDITRQIVAEAALAQQAADLTTLHHLALSIGATIEPRELLPKIVHETRAALDMTYAAVGLLNAAGDTIVVTAESAGDPTIELEGRRFPLDTSKIATAWRGGAPIVIDDPQHNQHLVDLRDLLTVYHIQSVLIIPLRASDQLIGGLYFASAATATCDQAKLHLAQMIAGYVAGAIANAQLFEASQQAVRTKTAILDTISHEFRTPITAILGFTELYQEQVLGPVTGDQAEALSAVHRNAHRLLKLVDDMLDLARLAAGRLDLTLHRVDIELCIKEAIAIVEAQSPEQALRIQLDIAADLPFAQADRMWLRRSLVHVLSYALSASLDRQIAIRAHSSTYTGQTAPGTTHDRNQLCIKISGDHLNLPEAERLALFDAFQAVPNQDSDLTISSIARLGMAISKRALEQMEGDLSMTSQPGHGDTFEMTLPTVGPARQSAKNV